MLSKPSESSFGNSCSACDAEAISKIDVNLKWLLFCSCHGYPLKEHLVCVSALVLLVLSCSLILMSTSSLVLWPSPHHHILQWLSHLLLKSGLLSWHKEPLWACPSLPSQAASLAMHPHVPSEPGFPELLSVPLPASPYLHDVGCPCPFVGNLFPSLFTRRLAIVLPNSV